MPTIESMFATMVGSIGDTKMVKLLEAVLAQAQKKHLYSDEQLIDAKQRLKQTTAIKQEKDFQVSALESPVFKDAFALYLDQPVSKELETRIATIAAKRKKTVQEVRTELKATLAGKLSTTRKELGKQLEQGLRIDPNDPMVAQMLPGAKRLAEAGNEAAKRLGEAATSGKPLDPKDLAAVAKGLDGFDPTLGLLDTSGIKTAEVRTVVEQFNKQTLIYRQAMDQNFSDIMRIINSGLPIELIVMLVMARFGDRSEEKLKRKLQEMALAEQLEKSQEVQSGALKLSDMGLRSSQMMFQEVQIEQQRWSQMMGAISAILKSIEEMINTVIRNFR